VKIKMGISQKGVGTIETSCNEDNSNIALKA